MTANCGPLPKSAVRTGYTASVEFVSDPDRAHALRVSLKNPDDDCCLINVNRPQTAHGLTDVVELTPHSVAVTDPA
jgi:hypothetical protein